VVRNAGFLQARADLTRTSGQAADRARGGRYPLGAGKCRHRAVGHLHLALPIARLDRTVLRAPVNGFVTNLTLDVGQYASVGTKVMALIDSDSYRITGYFEETKIPAVKRSGHVDIYLMSGGPPLHGHVESISRGITDRDNPAGPQLLADANPTFEWVRLAQRIPVRIHIDDVPKGVLISSGMTCTVVVQGPPRQWAVLAALRGWQAAAR